MKRFSILALFLFFVNVLKAQDSLDVRGGIGPITEDSVTHRRNLEVYVASEYQMGINYSGYYWGASTSPLLLFRRRFAFGPSFLNTNYGPDGDNMSGFMIDGLRLEYIFFPKSMIHFSIPLVLGYGTSINFEDLNESKFQRYLRPFQRVITRNRDYFQSQIGPRPIKFLWQPGFNVECNLNKNLMLLFGASYRFADQSRAKKKAEVGNGIALNLGMKFGSFKK
jgi:hypothetical protein